MNNNEIGEKIATQREVLSVLTGKAGSCFAGRQSAEISVFFPNILLDIQKSN